ncbi:MAG: aminopeptidase [Pseudomonas sp.]
MSPSFVVVLLDPALRRSVPLLLGLLLSGCASLDYYAQLGRGQLALLQARESVSQVLADPQRDPVLQRRLALAQQARDFASARLALPDNRSYRLYADLGRPYVVWNVFATPELSLVPLSHCFPIAGCVAYRGFYAQGRARGAAALLREEGLDTYVAGIEAYSTLGWFADPILNTMLRWDDQRLAATLFHELAHQRLYVADDTAFNESFASFVEQQGLREWQASRGLPVQDGGRQRQQFTALVLASRARLEALYISPVSDAQKRAGKAAEFARLRSEYRQRRDREWAGDKRYDAWIEAPLNNARLLPFGLYDQWVAAFAALFRQVDGAWPAFYARAAELGELPQAQREQALAALAAGG